MEIRKVGEGEAYVAREDIARHELILVNKPTLYFKISNDSDSEKNFEVILDQVKKNCLLQKSFFETMKLCPPATKNPADEQSPTYHYNNPILDSQQ